MADRVRSRPGQELPWVKSEWGKSNFEAENLLFNKQLELEW